MKRLIKIASLALMLLVAVSASVKAQTYDVDYKSQTIEQVTKDLK